MTRSSIHARVEGKFLSFLDTLVNSDRRGKIDQIQRDFRLFSQMSCEHEIIKDPSCGCEYHHTYLESIKLGPIIETFIETKNRWRVYCEPCKLQSLKERQKELLQELKNLEFEIHLRNVRIENHKSK